MTLYDKIKKRIVECVKSGENEERDVLRTLVGEIQLRVGREKCSGATDEMVEKMLSTFKENAYACTWEGLKETIEVGCTMPTGFEDGVEKAKREMAIYERFLPSYENVTSIVDLLQPDAERLKAAKATGPATGMAMGILVKAGKKIRGKDVAEAVGIIRGDIS